MASSSADCVLGGVRLISSASSTCANSGPGTKVQVRLPVAWSSSRMSVPVMSVGIRSGVNWMRLKDRPSALRQRAHQQRLGRARQAGDQAVPAHQQREQQLLHHFVLADDQLAHLAPDRIETRAEACRPVLRCLARTGWYRSLGLLSSHFQQQMLGGPVIRRGIEGLRADGGGPAAASPLMSVGARQAVVGDRRCRRAAALSSTWYSRSARVALVLGQQQLARAGRDLRVASGSA